jgi:hypothetical protein
MPDVVCSFMLVWLYLELQIFYAVQMCNFMSSKGVRLKTYNV